jgi:hypothetical protein
MHICEGAAQRPIAFLLVAVATLASVIAYMGPASGQEAQNSAPVYVTKIPSGYRDWRLISVAHEEGNLHSFAAVLGNDVAIKAYREGKLPFPDGAIIAALHYSHSPSQENNQVFGRKQSFVPGSPTNLTVHGQGLEKIRGDGRLGVRALQHRWQSRRRGATPDLLSLPREGFPRFCLHALRTLTIVS